jgi:hypothetical protein
MPHLLAASPCHGLSPAPRTLSQSDCPGVIRSSSRCPLVRPSKPRWHPWALPCAYTPCNACRGYAPRKHPTSLAVAATRVLPAPQGTAGRLLHTRSMSGLCLPCTDVPAYVLPVYASPGTLPSPTQDSVPDGWRGFVRAAIADGWTVYACKAHPPQNRAHRSPCTWLKQSTYPKRRSAAVNLTVAHVMNQP